jgi:hypothetical protein
MMRNRIWTGLRVFLPITGVAVGFSFSDIPAWLASDDIKALIAELVAQVAIGVVDAMITVATSALLGTA